VTGVTGRRRRSTIGSEAQRHWRLADAPDSTNPDSDTSGEDHSWGMWIPTVWRALSDPTRVLAVPSRRPTDLEAACAWWSPAMHLMLWSLGWPSPAQGLREWDRAGRPLADPRLSLIEAVWGRHLDALEHYLWHGCGDYEEGVSAALGLAQVARGRVPDDIPELTAASTSGANPATGGCDPLHLSHAFAAINDHSGATVLGIGDLGVSGPPRATLHCERYSGWYRSLTELGGQLPGDAERRGWRVDVTVASVGYLGTFRRSRRSGRWFAGQHRWHQLGIPRI
jgi:hypothetical protein